MAFRIGIDTGGTFTDLAVIDETGDFRMYKSPTTPHDYTEGILNTLKLCATDYNLELRDFLSKVGTFIVHGSTVATNAIIEGNGAKVGIIGTKGHTNILWRREGNREDVFNYYIDYPKPLVPTYLCKGVIERINSEGGVEVPLDDESVRTAIKQLKELDVQAIGVCLLWSVVNNAHERKVAEIIEEQWPGIPYSVSSDLQPVIREYNRTACVAFDSILKPLITKYVFWTCYGTCGRLLLCKTRRV
jgi:N-methylhydantoinase A